MDQTAPTTQVISVPAQPNNNGWYKSDVTVTFSAYDNLSGVAGTEYRINDGTWTAYSGPFTITAEGKNLLEFRSTDNAGNVEQVKSITINIDKTSPVISIVLDKTTLGAPNHKLVTVNAAVDANDSISGIASVVLTSITSNEPDNGLGDGNQLNDIQIINDTTFNLRAERSGSGTGRIYSITYTATDRAGNQTNATATVSVPHDASSK
ncbi:hypothetical protein FU659_29590 [Paenibacillus sp. N3.4]|nr:hypothetical protein FU659_29590 [Paenibacillus sp. N3.4]